MINERDDFLDRMRLAEAMCVGCGQSGAIFKIRSKERHDAIV